MSVFKIKDKRLNHDRWCVQIWRNGKCYRYYDNPTTGKPFSGKSEAKEAEARLRLAADSQRDSALKTPCPDLYDLYFNALKKKLKPSSVYTRLIFFKNYLKPEFDRFAAQDITNDDLDRLNDKLNRAPKGSMCNVISTARSWILFLRKWNPSLLPERIFHYLDPEPEDHVYHVYTLEEERKFLSVIDKPRDRLLFSLFCYYGFRMTECIALKYSDFDLDNNTVSVKRIVLTKSIYRQQIFTTPKTKRSIRTLALLPEIKEMLPEAQKSEYLFPSDVRSIVINEGHVRRLAKEYAKKAGLPPLKIHEFRHSCASNLLREKFPLRIVANWLGDTESTVLDYYSHMFSDEATTIGNYFASHSLLKAKKDKN